jgi:hypothetical protein
LFDVRLEASADRVRRAALAGIADRRERVAHRYAVAIALRKRMLERERAGEHARTHHHRHEA